MTIRLATPTARWPPALQPQIAAGEFYMDGHLVVENQDPYPFVDLMTRNLERHALPRCAHALLLCAAGCLPASATVPPTHASRSRITTISTMTIASTSITTSTAYFRQPECPEAAQADKVDGRLQVYDALGRLWGFAPDRADVQHRLSRLQPQLRRNMAWRCSWQRHSECGSGRHA